MPPPPHMKFGAISIGLAIIAILMVASCSTPSQTAFPERVFTAPWSMDPDSLGRLRSNVNAVNLGDDVTHVIKVVGIPDADRSVRKNETIRTFTYYVQRQRTDSPIESDRIVLIAFDDRNKVKTIYSNVEKINSRNRP